MLEIDVEERNPMAEHGLQVVVKFPKEVPLAAQGVALLQMEKELRSATGLDVRVVKDLMGDDSKLRSRMTIEMRQKL